MKDGESTVIHAAMQKLADRIRFVRRRAGLSQQKFANALGEVEGIKVTRGAVGNWELGKGIKRANLTAIANKFGYLGVTLDWLELNRGLAPNGHKPLTKPTTKPLIAENADHNVNARIVGPIGGFIRVPLRGQDMGGKGGSLIFNTDQNLGDILAPPILNNVNGAYAVYVIGESMLERFRPGEVVYVHPYMPVRQGDDCVVQIEMPNGERHGWVKRFICSDSKKLKLLQLNPKKIITFPIGRVHSVHRIIMSGPVYLRNRNRWPLEARQSIIYGLMMWNGQRLGLVYGWPSKRR